MAPCPPEVIAALTERFGELPQSEFRGSLRLTAPQESLYEVLEFLCYEQGFDYLTDLTCVDYLNYRGATDRFGLVYLLVRHEAWERLTVRCFLNEPNLSVPSATSLWEGANWMEREVYDLFGVKFQGHPDLRRIMLPEEFTAHPLRKDYPLQGRGERHNFPVLRRGDA